MLDCQITYISFFLGGGGATLLSSGQMKFKKWRICVDPVVKCL